MNCFAVVAFSRNCFGSILIFPGCLARKKKPLVVGVRLQSKSYFTKFRSKKKIHTTYTQGSELSKMNNFLFFPTQSQSKFIFSICGSNTCYCNVLQFNNTSFFFLK